MAKNKNRKRNATPIIKDDSKATSKPERVESSDDEDEVRYSTIIFGS